MLILDIKSAGEQHLRPRQHRGLIYFEIPFCRNASISDFRHATRRAEMRIGKGNRPAFIKRQMVEYESEVAARISAFLSIGDSYTPASRLLPPLKNLAFGLAVFLLKPSESTLLYTLDHFACPQGIHVRGAHIVLHACALPVFVLGALLFNFHTISDLVNTFFGEVDQTMIASFSFSLLSKAGALCVNTLRQQCFFPGDSAALQPSGVRIHLSEPKC